MAAERGTPPGIYEQTPRERLFLPENQRFAKQSALVTGVSKLDGIGAALCRGLSYGGSPGIVGVAQPHSAERVKPLIEEIQGEGTHMVWTGVDLSTPEGVTAVIDGMKDHKDAFGGAYPLLFLNAGVPLDQNFRDMSPEKLRKTLAINLEASMMLARYAFSEGLLPKGKGRIVITGSFVGTYGNKGGQEAYGAAKAGLGGFIRNAAQDLAEFGITVNGVFPGFVTTEMTSGTPPSYREAYTVATPVGRLGTPEDVAHHMLHFADPRSGFVTGQTLVVDGGLGNPGVIRRLLDNGYIRVNPQERHMIMADRRKKAAGEGKA